MKKISPAIALVGLAALVAYVLACRPAFSPDGRQVLLPVVEPDSGTITIVRHELGSRTALPLVALPSWEQGDDLPPMAMVRWLPDGQEALVAWAIDEDGPLWLMRLPVGHQRTPTRLFTIREFEGGYLSLISPPPIQGHHVFLGGEKIVRLDLDTGAQFEKGFTNGVVLEEQGDHIYYLREHPSAENQVEIGWLNPETLDLDPHWSFVRPEELDSCMFFAVSRDELRLASAAYNEDGQCRLWLFAGHDSVRTLDLGTTNQPLVLGNLIWSPDNRSLLAAAFRPAAIGSDTTEVCLFELDLERDAQRFTPVFRMEDSDKESTSTAMFQVALSPDGRWAAISNGLLHGDKDPQPSRRLFLVNLSRSNRPVTILPLEGRVQPPRSG
ncbi:MAG TPA: hypothetical protein P5555_09095 [Candidatus Paceibacterota bacterium]|nr:hypothetical protein [Verrucomicrobiota bacterium]HRZ45331.1 hypothetical protein [Candidatus Paceibacterota bacterium]